jgi:hypothetical protein
MYIGPQQRIESTAYSNFISGFDPAAQPISATLSSGINGYVLGSARDLGGYFVNSAENATNLENNTLPSISGAAVQLNIPRSGMSAQWIDPGTGNILQRFTPASGLQTLTILTFTVDIALRIRN